MANLVGLAVTLVESTRDSFAENPDAADCLETAVRDRSAA
jgi:hypothetical protein